MILAVASGFAVWLAIFLLGLLIGFWFWDVSPSRIASQGLVAFLSSLIGTIIAESAMLKIHPSLRVQVASLALGTLAALTVGTVLWLGYSPESGVATSLVVFFCALIPMFQGFASNRSRYSRNA